MLIRPPLSFEASERLISTTYLPFLILLPEKKNKIRLIIKLRANEEWIYAELIETAERENEIWVYKNFGAMASSKPALFVYSFTGVSDR